MGVEEGLTNWKVESRRSLKMWKMMVMARERA
jgi:hypothetical protein